VTSANTAFFEHGEISAKEIPDRVSASAGALISLLVACLSTWFYFSELLRGKLGLIDDHEYLSYLGPDRVITWIEFWDLLGQSEAGNWGVSTRFRPGYQFLRILQTKFFLGDASLWYSSRLVLFAFALFLIGFAVWISAGKLLRSYRLSLGKALVIQTVVSVWAMLSAVSLNSWSDILTRLGPSEIFVFVGLALMCFGLVAMRSSSKSWIWGATANVGFILAVSNKENAVLLLVPLMIFILIQIPTDRFPKVNTFMLMLSVFFGAWVASSVVVAVSRTGVDIYNEQRSISIMLQALVGNPLTPLVALFAVVVPFFELVLNQLSDRQFQKSSSGLLYNLRTHPISLVAVSILTVYIGEHYFYQNSIVGGVFQPARYGMVTELTMVLISLAVIILTLRAFGLLNKGLLPIGLKTLAAVLAIGLIYSSMGPIFSAAANYPKISQGLVAQKIQQMSVIDSMAQTLAESPDMQVLIFADEPFDYERVYSLPIFLDFYSGRKVNFYLDTRIPDELKPDAYFQGLANSLDKISLEGGWKISPLGEFDIEKEVLCIYFGQLVESEICTLVIGLD